MHPLDFFLIVWQVLDWSSGKPLISTSMPPFQVYPPFLAIRVGGGGGAGRFQLCVATTPAQAKSLLSGSLHPVTKFPVKIPILPNGGGGTVIWKTLINTLEPT